MNGELLSVRTTQEGRAQVVRARGEVDMSTAALLEDALGAACHDAAAPQAPSAHACIEVDLSAVTFFGTTGLAVLVTALGRCQALGIPLRLIAAGPAVVRQLRAVGLAGVFLSTPPDAPGYAA